MSEAPECVRVNAFRAFTWISAAAQVGTRGDSYNMRCHAPNACQPHALPCTKQPLALHVYPPPARSHTPPYPTLQKEKARRDGLVAVALLATVAVAAVTAAAADVICCY
jgi:hypothetical protein